MGYGALLDKSVKRAFNLLKDLAVPVALTRKDGAKFNFGTQEVSHATTTPVISKAIVISKTRRNKANNVMSQDILLQTKDVGDINGYATIAIGGVDWKLGEPVKSDGYVTMVEVYQEK